MAHVLLSDVIDIITAQYDEEPDSYVYGVSRTLVISHAKRVLQELSYVGMRSLRVVIGEVYASGKVELPDDYVDYVKAYYCVGNYLIPAFWNPHINTAQWEGLKDFEEKVIATETGKTIYAESGDYLAVQVRSDEGVKSYGDFHCNCFLKGYKYDDKNNCFIFDYVPDGVTHVAIEYVADPLISESNPDNLSVHKFFQKAIEAGVYLRLIETRRNVPMNEKIRAKREWNIKYKDAVKELNAKPWEYVQVIMGWRHMRKCNFSGMGGQNIPANIVEKADYSGRFENFVCQKFETPEYSLRYDGFFCQKIEVEELPEYSGRYDGFVCQKIEIAEYIGSYSEFVCQKIEGAESQEHIMTMTSLASSVKLTAASLAGTEVIIDWGDGSEDVVLTSEVSHTYSDGNEEHNIIIKGKVINLHCSDDKLTLLDVTRNVALETLQCHRNQLATLDIAANNKLHILYCNNNLLTSLNVAQNTVLKDLNCSNNKLTFLDITQNVNLEKLNCNYNQLASLDTTHCIALKHLYCYNNQLSSLNVSQNKQLSEFNCNNNSLVSLDVTQNTALESLNCTANKLASLDVTLNSDLLQLDCQGNQLISLDVTRNIALETLYCGTNRLASLNVAQNVKLRVLSCGDNQLVSLNVDQNPELYDFVLKNNKLTSLNVAGNSKLTYLNCTDNPLEESQDSMQAMVNSLPDRTDIKTGELRFNSSSYPSDLNELTNICSQKNWIIK